MLSPGRSFTDPPGLNHSAFTLNSTLGNSRPMRSSRSSGVFPMQSSAEHPAELELPGIVRSEEAMRSLVAIAVSGFLPAFSNQPSYRGCTHELKRVHKRRPSYL